MGQNFHHKFIFITNNFVKTQKYLYYCIVDAKQYQMPMKNKRKSKVNKTYVETRNKLRKETKRAIRHQLAHNEGEFEVIEQMAGVQIDTVYKVLNTKQRAWSQKVIDAAKEYIKDRNKKLGIPPLKKLPL